MQADFQIFRATFRSWEALFEEAAEFCSRLGPDRVISISHSADQAQGVVVVWYWTDEPVPGRPGDGETSLTVDRQA